MKDISKDEIVRLAGLDKTPDQIIADREQQEKSWQYRYLQFRRQRLAIELFRGNGSTTLSIHTVWWILYLLIQASIIFVAITHGFTVEQLVADLCTTIIIANFFFFFRHADDEKDNMDTIARLSLMLMLSVASAIIAGLISLSIDKLGYQAVKGITFFVSSNVIIMLFIDACLKAQRGDKSFKQALRLYDDSLFALVLTPLWLPLRILDHRLLKERDTDVDLASLPSAENRAKYVQGIYKKGLARIREELLGADSVFEKNKAFLDKALTRIRSDKAEAELRIAKLRDTHPTLAATVKETYSLLVASEQRHQERLDKIIQQLIPKIDAAFRQLEEDIQKLDVFMTTKDFVKRVQEARADDDVKLSAIDLSLQQELTRLGKRLHQLQSAVSSAVLSESITDSEKALDAWIEKVDATSLTLAELEHDAEPPEEPLLAEGTAVH